MRDWQIYLIIAYFFCLIGCNTNPVERQLCRAETLMDQAPDSALIILKTVDSQLLDGELRARHALLVSQAYDKNYNDVVDDSLINVAFDYYRYSDDDYRLMQSAYYKSVVAQNGHNFLESMKYAAISDTLATQLQNHKYIGLSASIMLFNSKYLSWNKSAIDFGYRARRHFTLAQDEENANLISQHLANSLMSSNRFSEAIMIIDSIDDMRVQAELRAYLFCMRRQNDKVDSILNIIPSLRDDSWLCSYRAGNIIESGGDLREAEILLDHAINHASVRTDTTIYMWTTSRLAKADGRFHDYIKGVEWYEDYLEIKNWKYQQIMIPKSYADGFDFIKERDANKLQQAERELKSKLYLSLAFVISLIFLLFAFAQYQARKKAELKQKIYALQTELSRNFDLLQNELRIKEDNIGIFYSLNERIDTLLVLSNLYKYAETEVERNKISLQIKQQITKLSDKTFLRTLQQVINDKYGGLINRIVETKLLKEFELEILTYIYAGLSINLISIICEKSYNAVAVTRHRIKERLNNAGFELEFLCKPLEIAEKPKN